MWHCRSPAAVVERVNDAIVRVVVLGHIERTG